MSVDAMLVVMKIHSQPLGFRTPDGGRYGYTDLPEFPYGKIVFIALVLLKLYGQSHWKMSPCETFLSCILET